MEKTFYSRSNSKLIDIEKFEYIMKKHIELFNKNTQLIVAIEECSELTKAITKYLRKIDNFPTIENYDELENNIIEESIDVYILLNQIRYIFNITSKWDKYFEIKYFKALDRIKRHNKGVK